jgi:hypothetical protein
MTISADEVGKVPFQIISEKYVFSLQQKKTLQLLLAPIPMAHSFGFVVVAFVSLRLFGCVRLC